MPKACAVVCIGAVSLFKVILPSVKVARVTESSEFDSFIGNPPLKLGVFTFEPFPSTLALNDILEASL